MAVKTISAPKHVQGGGAAWVDVPGIYHCSIVDVDEAPQANDKSLIDGTKLQLAILEGPQKTKQFDLMLFNPNPVKDGEKKWPERKIMATLIATGIKTEADLGEQVAYDMQDARSRQIVIELQKDDRRSTAEKSFLQMAWANIYHVDDPRVANVPKNGDALKLLPASQRRDPKSFDLDKLAGKEPGEAGAGAPSGKTTVNVDDL